MMLLFTLLACASGGDEDVCADICMELTVNCAYEAYPNYGSCEQGCLFEADKGEDMSAEVPDGESTNGRDALDQV